ncbi:MAG: hypothetical protein Q9223_004998 [Gallowayella weberi]
MGIVSSSTSRRPGKKSHSAAIKSPSRVAQSSAAKGPARGSTGLIHDVIDNWSESETDIHRDELSAPTKAMKPSQLRHVSATPLKAAVLPTINTAMALATPPTQTTANAAKTHAAAIHAVTTLTTPPTTPSVPRPASINNSSPAAQKTPTRGIRPTRGMRPPRSIARPRAITTSSHKRASSPQSINANHAPIKRLQLNNLKNTSPTPPAISNDHIHPSSRIPISSFEARRIRESVMRQIDWDEVAYHVATNGTERRYRRAVRNVFDEWETGLVAREVSDE